MQRWLPHLYFLEFVLIAVPVTIFQVITLALLAGVLPSADPAFSGLLFALWVGGCFGTYALWSLYFRIYKNQSSLMIRELPLVALALGVASNTIAVFYFIFTVNKQNQIEFVALCLLFLAPAYVALHWMFVLTRCRHA